MIKDLLSIVTPCYNSGAFVHKLLDSILMQTYPSIEMFLIDDGSIDNTAEVVQSYIRRFEDRGYKLTYIFQQNGGQSVAINNGLKLINGEFFVWPDSDDFYTYSYTLERLIDGLKSSNDETGMIRCRNLIVDEITGQERKTKKNRCVCDYSNLFEDCLYGANGFWFLSGGYIVKTEALFDVIPTKSIYTSKNAGQNWQLMLPMLYKYKCITIEDKLYTVTERMASHSRGQYSTFEQVLSKFEAYEATLLETISCMLIPKEKKNTILKSLKDKYTFERMKVCISHYKQNRYRIFYNEIKNYVSIVYRAIYFLSYIPYSFILIKLVNRVVLKLKSMF